VKAVALGTVAEVIAGQSPEGIYYNRNGEGVPFYQGKKEFGNRFLGEPTTWTSKVTKLAQPGDILMSVRAPVGPINISTQEICIGRGLAAIRSSRSIDRDYLFYFLMHKQPEISGNTGAVFDSINKDQISSIEIPLPSLEMQGAIVDKLDTALAEIDLLERNLVRLGNCTEELIDSIQQDLFLRDFKSVLIGDVCKLSTGGTPSRSRPEYFLNGSVKWLVSGDIHQGEIYDCEGRITLEGMKSSNTKILPLNSVMIALNGQGKTRGTVAILRTEATCNQSLVSISPIDETELAPEFLFYNLKMRYQELRRMTGDDGNDRRGLNMILIRGVRIPLPPLEEQRLIINALDSAYVEMELVREKLKVKRDVAKQLRQSLMHQVFNNFEMVV
jgi:type I restriction enzyme S subunit